MTCNLLILFFSMFIGAMTGYSFPYWRILWAFADILWVTGVFFSVFFAIDRFENLSASADRNFYIEQLAHNRDFIRLEAYRLKDIYCIEHKSEQPTHIDKKHLYSFCTTLENIQFFSGQSMLFVHDAKHLLKEVENHQGKFLPENSMNLISELYKYIHVLNLRKSELDVNPYQEAADYALYIELWLYLLAFLLLMRFGRTFAEIRRLRTPRTPRNPQKPGSENNSF